MDETRVCYTEYSKSEKQILFTIAHNMESKKMVLMKLFAGQRGDTDIENRLEDVAGGGRKERVGCVERVPWKHTLPYVKWRASGVCCMTGSSSQGSATTWRVGWGGAREGACAHPWLAPANVWRFTVLYSDDPSIKQ